MKNKIIALALSTVLLLASLALCVFAAGETVTSGIFTIENVPENYSVVINEEPFEDVTKEFLNAYFDKDNYNAEYYGAYRASILDSEIPAAFTENMDVSISLGDEYAEKEIFVFYITYAGTPSEKVKTVRDGASIKISGKDFAAMSDHIIVVMTSNKDAMTGPEYTIVPAVICATVALIAIIGSVLVVRRKAARNTIVD